jgi:hypothetical protein
LRNKGKIRPWKPEEVTTLSCVHPRDVHRFYQDFYRTLQEAGVDLTKVDGQSALEILAKASWGA